MHLLFDCGGGVTDSLIDHGIHVASALFVSHSHPDHSLDLDRLANSHRRSGGAVPLDLYCTERTLNDGPRRLYPWFFPGTLRHRPVTPLTRVDASALDPGINLRITPVEVWHGPIPKEPVIWVIEFGDKASGTYRKLVLAWDLLHLVPRYPDDDADEAYDATDDVGRLADGHREVLPGADELFAEANTLRPYPSSGHISAHGVMRSLIPLTSPSRTWLVHYSGHEDAAGPLSDEHLQEALDKTKDRFGLAGHPLGVARHGMVLTYQM